MLDADADADTMPIAPTRLDRGALLRDHLCALHDGTRLQAVQPPTHALLRHIGA